VRPLTDARIAVREYYRRNGLNLEFSFDGNLVGDLGEACAVEEYGMKLVNTRSTAGFDGHTPDGKQTVQVKAKGRSAKTIAFSYSEMHADHLLVLNWILIAARAALSTTVRNAMCGSSCPKNPGRGRSKSAFRSFDKRRHGFAMTSVFRW
jgi:hypothetical protein